MDSWSPGSGLFPHAVGPGLVPRWRSHVACFADQVYPIQALARLHMAIGDIDALATAQACTDRICQLQGNAGQWWWHYDVRTGSVVEGYPVYSVHQHAMGPMALLDLRAAGGSVEMSTIANSLRWMQARPESGEDIIREDLDLTWRKVARRDPLKLVRAGMALTTAARPGWRPTRLDKVLTPGVIDRECRPYELGWLLDTWLAPSASGRSRGSGVR